MKAIISIILLVGLLGWGFAQNNPIIPAPVSCQFSEGKFLNVDQIRFYCAPEQEVLVQNFGKQLTQFRAKPVQILKSGQKSANLVLIVVAPKTAGQSRIHAAPSTFAGLVQSSWHQFLQP